MVPKRTYRVMDPVPEEVSEELKEYDGLTRQLLFNRGISKADAAMVFLSPNYDEHLHDPMLLTDMDRAVSRILDAVRNDEHSVIYSDYDCDGIPGGVLLHDLFVAIGYTNFENYIPHRHHEGYGFNAESVSGFLTRNTKLIVTVDCGIVDHEAVEAANKAGIDVIITDHHEPGETLPPAHAVVNPKRDDAYPFSGLCGTGVAFKLAQALIAKGVAEGIFTFTPGQEKWWLDVVGIATVADMVPLSGENRVLAHYGLHVLRKSRRPGIQHLMRLAGGSQRHLTEDDIGFTIGPRINAASRMDNPEDAFHMLRTRDEVEAGERVRHLEKLNNERKGVVASMTKEAKKRLLAHGTLPNVIVIGNPEWRPSLVGLVANALAEEFKRPAFLWGRDGRNILKGSCRSEGSISTLRLMEAARDAFIDFGGHHESGGFSVSDDTVHTLFEALNNAYETLGSEVYSEREEAIDTTLRLTDVGAPLLKTLRALAPFGEGNAKPLFQFIAVTPVRVEVFGKAKNHMKLLFEEEGVRLEAIAFFRLPESFDIVPEAGKEVSLIAHVEESYFMGRLQTRLRVVDIV